MALCLFASSAFAETVAETVSNWGLIGAWSLDCALPNPGERWNVWNIRLPPGATALRLDVCSQESIDAMIAAVVAQRGRLDILINNAGIFDLAPIVEISRESYHRVFAVNVGLVVLALFTVVVPGLISALTGLAAAAALVGWLLVTLARGKQ